MLVTLIAPPGLASSFADSLGNIVTLDATGRCSVDPAVVRLKDFFDVGFVPSPEPSGAVRPSETYPGQPFFDTTLGRPIWRRADNAGWVDATGATV